MADDRTYIKVHDGMPENPKIVGLSDRAFRALIELWITSQEGIVDIETIKPNVRDELWAAGVLFGDGTLWGHGSIFVGPLVVRRTRPAIPKDLRTSVYMRDGYACVTCHTTKNLSLDHRHPYSLGGEDTYENLQTMCLPCNMAKGARI